MPSSNLFDSLFLKSGSFWPSFLITCLLNNSFRRMFFRKIFFTSLRSHSRILKVAFRELLASLHTSKLDIILIISCNFCFYLLQYLGNGGNCVKPGAADFMLRYSTEWPKGGGYSWAVYLRAFSLLIYSHLMPRWNFDRKQVSKRECNHSLGFLFDLEQGSLLMCHWFPRMQNKELGLGDFQRISRKYYSKWRFRE